MTETPSRHSADSGVESGVGAGVGLAPAVLVRLTAAKSVANTALRWIPPFLPTLEAAFGASTTQLTTILGVGELAGLSTVPVGPVLDRGRERWVMVAALGAVSASSFVALAGTTVSFAIAFFILIIGVANYTVAGQAYISHRVTYRRHARAIGLFELSWAIALLVGAPIVAVLINTFGWRGPFLALGVGSAIAAVVIALSTPDRVAAAEPSSGGAGGSITTKAWLVIVGSATIAMAGLSVFVISGSWLDDQFGLSTNRLGIVAMSFGAVELASSGTSAAVADRLGKMRCTMAGLVGLAFGLVVMAVADESLELGITGLLVFLLGFEFAFVTSLSLVSEAMPDARGTTLAMSNAVGTLARSAGVVASGLLYGTFGIGGTLWLSAGAAVIAMTSLMLSRRSTR